MLNLSLCKVVELRPKLSDAETWYSLCEHLISAEFIELCRNQIAFLNFSKNLSCSKNGTAAVFFHDLATSQLLQDCTKSIPSLASKPFGDSSKPAAGKHADKETLNISKYHEMYSLHLLDLTGSHHGPLPSFYHVIVGLLGKTKAGAESLLSCSGPRKAKENMGTMFSLRHPAKLTHTDHFTCWSGRPLSTTWCTVRQCLPMHFMDSVSTRFDRLTRWDLGWSPPRRQAQSRCSEGLQLSGCHSPSCTSLRFARGLVRLEA